MNIKEFIGNDAKAAVLGNPEDAGFLLAETIGWKTYCRQPELRMPVHLFQREQMWRSCNLLTENWDFCHEAELATIEKVGAEAYGRVLEELLLPNSHDKLAQFNIFAARFATADAPTRVAAMLLALQK